ncbi:serine-rich adhesin for platelets [Musca vetustissima]|uniref:serine-rich adhesin for platelets n=1 Tax=Musca vetustissima TaxID=27455 RepID=UPI002AB7C50B|nr:serine-rich adhesin for platelets [Musca vetustissima]
MQRGQEDLMRSSSSTTTAFEYSFPTNNDDEDDDDDDDTESNKSTPYFTPMEFIQSPFEFPTPRLTDTTSAEHQLTSAAATLSSNVQTCVKTNNSELESMPSKEHTQHHQAVDNQQSPRILQISGAVPGTPKAATALIKHLEPSSPKVKGKYRRFSLYERRSCSPQHLIIKNASSAECTVDTDKENTKPKTKATDKQHDESHSGGNNSPSLILDETTGSPRILTSSEAAMISSGRLSYSPKLLTSINNLHLASPLGVISSAGYKNGNYFKFPEIDHVVQQETSSQTGAPSTSAADDNSGTSRSSKDNHKRANITRKSASNDNQTTSTPNSNFESFNETEMEIKPTTSAILPRIETKRNRKNKNNLTIKIINNSSSTNTTTSSSSTSCNNTGSFYEKPPLSPNSSNKPKTPTIKSTKEKALSLDSAHTAKESTTAIKSTLMIKPELYLSCDEIDSNLTGSSNRLEIQSQDRLRPHHPNNTRSTSMSQLTIGHGAGSSAKLNKNIRRRIPNSNSVDWHLHQRKYPTLHHAIPDPITKKLTDKRDDAKLVVILKEDEEVSPEQQQQQQIHSYSALQTPNSSTCTSTPSSALRTPYKHNPLLHNSNTNLKTLPEFLTLVEFSTNSASAMGADHPYKQKSMDLPSSSTAVASIPGSRPPNSSSSTNLLQRRGSNHSLTLNLHSQSYSNLLGSCRSGLSVSNYSLGSVGNSSNNLNSKSSCNLNISTSQTSQTTNTTATVTSQGARQSLFRRRGSNQSLTLTNLSCGNLNSFASQNSLNVERSGQLPSLARPIANASLTTTPRRGLLERRGSNQSLTLNMSSSFGGIGSERGALGNSSINLGDAAKAEEEIKATNHHSSLMPNCSVHSHQRRFFSSESLNRNNSSQFGELNPPHKRNANQLCFGSVNDLKPSPDRGSSHNLRDDNTNPQAEHFDFKETSVCTCPSIRNIMTKPLSPQTTSEEFKIYLANIQMLQNASNALNQNDLIKLNYIFDNSYASRSKGIADQSIPILMSTHNQSSKEAETPPPAMISNSEDCEIIERYMQVVRDILQTLQPDEEEQKRMFLNLHKEFWDLPLNHQEKPMVFGSQTKNRYKTILPNENSRVILEKESKLLMEMMENCCGGNVEVDEETLMDGLTKPSMLVAEEVPYINANYIKGPDYTSKCYIATQGPLPNTIYEFWLMIYQNTKKYIKISKGPDSPSRRQGKLLQQYYQKIVMLTNFMENNRQKCSVYFPVELNEIFITTPREEVVQASDKFTDFINPYLSEEAMETEIDETEGTAVKVIKIACNKVEVDDDLKAHLPNSKSFFVMKNVGIVKKNGFSIRKILILYCANFTDVVNIPYLLINKFVCYHYWYPDWPDHRSPRDINTLLDISLHVSNLGKCESEFEVFSDAEETPPSHVNAQSTELYQQDIFNAVQPLPVIHCSAGIGRTGCMTAILNGIRQVRQSLAYSLTSMAAKAAKQATSAQALSPVDFRLPRQFLEEDVLLLEAPIPTDIDCSFTRNTLLYMRYILKMEKKIKEQERQQQQQQQRQSTVTNESHQDVDESSPIAEEEGEEKRRAYEEDTWRLPSVAELPKMPNIFVDVLGIVCNLRLQRGGMVQNSEQYELIHRAICLYLKRTFALKRF